MRRNKIAYWIFTCLVALPAFIAGVGYLTHPFFDEAFSHYGLPDYLRIELGIAKMIGVLILIIPEVPPTIKEWAYAGFAITFISAIVAHAQVDGLANSIAPATVLLFLILSYIQFRRLQHA